MPPPMTPSSPLPSSAAQSSRAQRGVPRASGHKQGLQAQRPPAPSPGLCFETQLPEPRPRDPQEPLQHAGQQSGSSRPPAASQACCSRLPGPGAQLLELLTFEVRDARPPTQLHPAPGDLAPATSSCRPKQRAMLRPGSCTQGRRTHDATRSAPEQRFFLTGHQGARDLEGSRALPPAGPGAAAPLPISGGPSVCPRTELATRCRCQFCSKASPSTEPGHWSGSRWRPTRGGRGGAGPLCTVLREAYSRTTVPPTASRAALIFSASALGTLALISWGRDSTSFFACQRGKSDPGRAGPRGSAQRERAARARGSPAPG